jgi:hypothetical protein
MHGAITLRTALPGFPWPDPDQFTRGLVLSLAKVGKANAAACA